MKIKAPQFFAILTTALCLSITPHARAQDKTTEPSKEPKSKSTAKKADDASKPVGGTQKPLPSDPEERFKALFTKAALSGRWAPLKDGELGDERPGDKYEIVNVVKGSGDKWTVNAKMKYRDREVVMPIPVEIKYSGDTTILTVDNLSIPNGGTYTARLLIYERTYSGTWKGQRGGGMLYGTIKNDSE